MQFVWPPKNNMTYLYWIKKAGYHNGNKWACVEEDCGAWRNEKLEEKS
jgi:hypothetical protein